MMDFFEKEDMEQLVEELGGISSIPPNIFILVAAKCLGGWHTTAVGQMKKLGSALAGASILRY